MFSKILIANRGEIAVRIIRACEELGVASVAVYSELDRDAPHVKRAMRRTCSVLVRRAESYLNVEKLIEVIRPRVLRRCIPAMGFWRRTRGSRRGLRSSGSRSSARPHRRSRRWVRRRRARELMAAAGVPIVPGTTEPVETVDDARRIIAEQIGFPVAVKAAGGGGGKGFRVALTTTSCRRRLRVRRGRARSSSQTRRCIWSATCRTPGMSRCRSWPTSTAT